MRNTPKQHPDFQACFVVANKMESLARRIQQGCQVDQNKYGRFKEVNRGR